MQVQGNVPARSPWAEEGRDNFMHTGLREARGSPLTAPCSRDRATRNPPPCRVNECSNNIHRNLLDLL